MTNNDLLSVDEMPVDKASDKTLIGNRISVDLEHNNVETVQEVAPLNGWVGDDGRVVRFKLFNGRNQQGNRQVQSLVGMSIALGTVDSAGVPKITRTFTRVNDAAGEFNIKVPGAFYQASGRVKEAFLFLYSDLDGKTLIGSVPISFVVRNKLMEVALNSKPFDSAFLELNKELLKMHNEHQAFLDKQVEEVTNRIKLFNDTLRAQGKQADTIKETVDNLIKLIEKGGVPTFGGNNIYTGDNEFLKFVTGFMTGTVIRYFNGNNPQQDLNDPQVLRDMRSGTTQTTYYGGNEVKNNPIGTDYIVVTRHKITGVSVYEQAMFFGQESGVIKARVINDVAGATRFGAWGTVAEWGAKWQSLVPYLSDNFIAHAAAPSFRVVGDKVEFKGAITARKTITNTSNVSIKLTKALPFEFFDDQDELKVSGGSAIYALFAFGNQLEMQKHQMGGNWTDIVAGNYIGISSTFNIK